jgi:hypothetical protein
MQTVIAETPGVERTSHEPIYPDGRASPEGYPVASDQDRVYYAFDDYAAIAYIHGDGLGQSAIVNSNIRLGFNMSDEEMAAFLAVGRDVNQGLAEQCGATGFADAELERLETAAP